LWGWDSEDKKNAWIKWDSICKPKVEGGLDPKQLDSFNKVLLDKWKWRLGSFENDLWKNILVSKYGSWRNLFDPTTLRHVSRW